MKKCTRCKIEKSKSEFGKFKRGKDGLHPQCKVCRNKYMRDRYQIPQVKEHISEWGKKYYNTPEVKEHISERGKKYYNTPRGKEVSKKRNKRYKQTPKGKESEKRYRQTPKGKKVRRGVHLKHTYGITLEQYDDMLGSQEYGCAICGSSEPGGIGRFHVDHDHITGKVRGLLCNKCNLGLAGFRDNIEFLVKAIEYLKLAEGSK